MFIYKISIIPTGQCYIGLDMGPEYKESRWKSHCKMTLGNSKLKVHREMRIAGLSNCNYEVIERGFTTKASLALAEIRHIKEHNSFISGLNSTPGGDGLGKGALASFSDEEIDAIKDSLGVHFRDYNKKKWTEMSVSDRKKATEHLHNDEIYERRSDTLRKFYDNNPEIKEEKGKAIKVWRKENSEYARNMSIQNLKRATEKISKSVVLEKEDGTILTYSSRQEMQRETGQWFSTLLDKSSKGLYHNGYRLKEY